MQTALKRQITRQLRSETIIILKAIIEIYIEIHSINTDKVVTKKKKKQ